MDLLSRTSCLPARIYLLVCMLTRSFISLTVLLLALLKVGTMLKFRRALRLSSCWVKYKLSFLRFLRNPHSLRLTTPSSTPLC